MLHLPLSYEHQRRAQNLRETWDALTDYEPGDTVYRGTIRGVELLILRGHCSLNAYVGIPLDHPLANKDYDDIPLECHGGLTYANAGSKNSSWPEGFYWYGWDYGHCMDMPFFALDPYMGQFLVNHLDEHPWTVDEVERELYIAGRHMRQLMDEVESYRYKTYKWLQRQILILKNLSLWGPLK